ncbi:predicted protein [Nematostella vectensis]|uniref:Kinetochore protein SPC25 n=1 Tax=Nematostella vectensis TaxID=45351 RepID=A7T9J1_NEMVE|nr:predicted protein [Nematostella vectensis]|eukprot:XP_001619433.1 hypothetical protein NEMVEDRAFT_v1g224186 [Nematostella vectensis]
MPSQDNQPENNQVLAEQRDNDKDHLQMLEQQISRENKDIMDKEEAAKAKLEHFQKGSELFRKSLGLEFKKIDDDHLQFVFKYIDPNDWERPFTFTVRIDSNDRSYKGNANSRPVYNAALKRRE